MYGCIFFSYTVLAKAVYIRLKVVGPFPGPCASENYVHQVVPLQYLQSNMLTDQYHLTWDPFR
jgi:hypothetical protein